MWDYTKANGGGPGIGRNYLEIYNPATSQHYPFSGNSPYDIAGLTSLLNNPSLTFDGTTTTTFATGSTVALNGTTTVAAGVTDIGKSGVTYGVFGKLATLNDRSDTALNPTGVNPALSSGLTASAAPFLQPTYVYSRKGTNGAPIL